jgi:molybdopterin/thiamine biosynthesis adenylyltransferase
LRVALSEDELERYARHLVLPEIGGPGQAALKRARVMVIGAGGLGAPVLLYLAAVGVGHLGIADDDVVSLSNLQRQIIHTTQCNGLSKTASASEAIANLNPNVDVAVHETRLTDENAHALISGHELVIDGSDNFDTRYAVADAAQRAGLPLLTGAVGRFDGSVTLLAPHLTDENGTPNPTFRCLFPERPAPGTVPSCAEAGVLGALTGVIGTLMAMEAIKWITGAGKPLIGRLLLYDALAARFDEIGYRRNPKNESVSR